MQKYWRTYFTSLERVPLLKLLLVLVFIDQDEIDPSHAVIEEKGVGFVVKLRLGTETQLCR